MYCNILFCFSFFLAFLFHLLTCVVDVFVYVVLLFFISFLLPYSYSYSSSSSFFLGLVAALHERWRCRSNIRRRDLSPVSWRDGREGGRETRRAKEKVLGRKKTDREKSKDNMHSNFGRRYSFRKSVGMMWIIFMQRLSVRVNLHIHLSSTVSVSDVRATKNAITSWPLHCGILPSRATLCSQSLWCRRGGGGIVKGRREGNVSVFYSHPLACKPSFHELVCCITLRVSQNRVVPRRKGIANERYSVCRRVSLYIMLMQ